jgi:hypothetical protein
MISCQGLTTSIPVSSKSLPLRVASAAPRVWQMAAICASKPLDWQSKAVATRHDLRVSDSGIHYSLEADDGIMTVTRWLVLDIALPIFFRPLRPLSVKLV